MSFGLIELNAGKSFTIFFKGPLCQLDFVLLSLGFEALLIYWMVNIMGGNSESKTANEAD